MDPWCIAPYRWLPDLPEWGYMVGTCVLAVQTVVLGLLTLRLGQRMHALPGSRSCAPRCSIITS